jgi:hypothetical protein
MPHRPRPENGNGANRLAPSANAWKAGVNRPTPAKPRQLRCWPAQAMMSDDAFGAGGLLTELSDYLRGPN